MDWNLAWWLSSRVSNSQIFRNRFSTDWSKLQAVYSRKMKTKIADKSVLANLCDGNPLSPTVAFAPDCSVIVICYYCGSEQIYQVKSTTEITNLLWNLLWLIYRSPYILDWNLSCEHIGTSIPSLNICGVKRIFHFIRPPSCRRVGKTWEIRVNSKWKRYYRIY